jgi:hypothetical protein
MDRAVSVCGKLPDPRYATGGGYPGRRQLCGADKERQPLPVSGDAERPLPDARRDVPGRPEG